jgi:hypothetical protein
MTSLSSLYITGIPTTSTDIADQLTDETGSGALVFSNSPTFTGSPLTPTPTLPGQVANKSYVDAYTFRKVEIGAISSGITAEVSTHYAVDTTAGAVTINLPAGSSGARIAFSDPAGNFSVNSLTLVPNGSETIVGVAPLELNTDFASVLLYWHTSLGRWCFETAENFFAAPVIPPATFSVAVSDENTPLTLGTGKLTFRMPYAMSLTAVRASVKTAPTGATLVVDINQNGSTILGTKLSIDSGEKTSVTAATPATITVPVLADDSEMSIDIDQIGATVAGTGLKVTLIGTAV